MSSDSSEDSSPRPRSVFDRIESLNDWVFLAFLYAAQSLLVLPYSLTASAGAESADESAAWLLEYHPVIVFLYLVLLGPLLETLVECTVSYKMMSWLFWGRKKRPRHPWGFIAFSAGIMAASHPGWAAIYPSLATGALLAYAYARFARRSHWAAIGYTTLFHASINVVGWGFFLTV